MTENVLMKELQFGINIVMDYFFKNEDVSGPLYMYRIQGGHF